MRKLLLGVAVLFGLLIVAVGVLAALLHHSLPPGAPGPAGDRLARAVEGSVNGAAWARTGAVRWKVMGREHLWDRQRGLARVRFDGKEVLLDVNKVDGRAFSSGRPLDGEAARKAIDKGYRLWINDSFWLNPLVKLFDPGTRRAAVEVDGKPALLIAYESGGVTPGDRYLWLLDQAGRPRAWRVWAKILPVGGMEFTWERWQTLATGAVVATLHRVMGRPLVDLRAVAGAASLRELEGDVDPFAPLF